MLSKCEFTTDIDKSKAIELFKSMAEMGNESTQYILAICYQNEEEEIKAFELYQTLAEN
ncbi:4028_t:CDS:2 [Funneliformis geosporum]|nr:4028_t:CDS:2 [Funneliformis geosporum]